MIDKTKCKAIYYRKTGGKGENRQYTKECGEDLAKEITKIKNARVYEYQNKITIDKR